MRFLATPLITPAFSNHMTRSNSRQVQRQNKPKDSPVQAVRTIPALARTILLVNAGGRCEFDGCNKYLLEHHVTLTEGNFAEVAHIVAFRPDGPRGQQSVRPKNINRPDNLMVLCPACHKLVDDNPERYTKQTLERYKENHENHVRHMTGLSPELKTSVLIFAANIGEQQVFIPFDQVLEAVSPRYPASRPGKMIDLTAIHVDDARHLETAREEIKRRIAQLYDAGSEVHTTKHLSVFGLGPISLLVDLGARLSNKIPTDLFQLHRDTETWTWKEARSSARYRFVRRRLGKDSTKVSLLLSLSGQIAAQDLPHIIDERYSIYEITLSHQVPRPTFLASKADLENFRLVYQKALSTITRNHGLVDDLHLFPAVPAPVAILLGRELLPKVHPALHVYDFNKRNGGFTFQLKVNANEQ